MKRTMLLKDALKRYINCVSTHKAGWKQELYRSNVISRYGLSDMPLHKISSVDISEYRDKRLSESNPTSNKKVSNNTVRLELAFLSSVFKIACIEWGVCKINPVTGVRKPPQGKGRERRLRSSEERQISKETKATCIESYTIFQLALETAMRQGEILGLLWENINLQIGIAHLPVTKNGSWRDVPLSKKARDLLLAMNPRSQGKVFTFTSNSFKSKWRKYLKKLQIEDLHFHDLRHEAISRLFELDTLNVMEVAAISGHKSLAMLKRYTHLRAYQLVKKIDSKAKKRKQIASYFTPYPAQVTYDNGIHCVRLTDFNDLSVTSACLDTAMTSAKNMLLRILAVAAHDGKKIPSPGELQRITPDMVIINPLS